MLNIRKWNWEMKVNGIALVLALLGSVIAFAAYNAPLDPGTVNGLTTTAEDCFLDQQGRISWTICNMDTAIDIRYMLMQPGTTNVVTTTTGIELKPGQCDSYPVGGEHVFTGRVSCIAESGTPNANTWAY